MTVERTSSEQRQDGHNFSVKGDVCTWCEMSLEHYEDRGRPRCRGVRPPQPWKRRTGGPQ